MRPEIEIRRHLPHAPWTYALLDRRQREIAARVRAGGPGALLLSEVAPVITMGRRTRPGDLLLSRELLASRGIEVHTTDRGGLATYHGPGQWVLFAVDRLDRLTGDPRGVRRAVEGLLELAREVGVEHDASAMIREGAETGVWGSRGKFAAVGVHIEERVLLHGLAVNGFRTEQSFTGLRPCGLDAPVQFLLESFSEAQAAEKAEKTDVAFKRLGERLVEAASVKFWPLSG